LASAVIRPRTVESNVDDSDLVTRAQHGDVEAFAALTRARARRLFSVARMIVRDDELAADVVQDTLLRAWTDLKALRDPDRYDAWLRRILVRACYGAARRRSRGVVEITLAPDWEPASIAADDSPSAVALRDQLERAFGRLSPEQRATVVLHFYLGLTLDEAAEVLGIPTGTMRSRLNRALQAMRAAVEADDRSPSLATELVP
jgi:RNA polymerase sigma-70 factor (ECF subfamily)